jgi:gamma-tubulin complex component 4
MLHELLLALVGCTGDVFVDVKQQASALGLTTTTTTSSSTTGCSSSPHPQQDSTTLTTTDDDCTFRLAPDLSFLQHSEREVLDKLLRLGFYYRELNNFCLQSRNLSWINSSYPHSTDGSNAKQPSVYRRALANGIVEVLAVYRSAVLQVEQALMSDPVPVLASVTQGLYQFEGLLPPLHALIREVEREELRGGRLLNLLHAKCHCGVPELQACMQRFVYQSSTCNTLSRFVEKYKGVVDCGFCG